MQVRGLEVFGKSLHFPLNVSVNLKLPLKMKCLNKMFRQEKVFS